MSAALASARRSTCRGSAQAGEPSGSVMSQNIRAVSLGCPSGRRHHLEGARVGLGEHVGLVDPGEALDGRAVEPDALGERGLDLGRRHRHGLQVAGDVGEPQPHEADVALFEGAQDELLLSVHARHDRVRSFPGCDSARSSPACPVRVTGARGRAERRPCRDRQGSRYLGTSRRVPFRRRQVLVLRARRRPFRGGRAAGPGGDGLPHLGRELPAEPEHPDGRGGQGAGDHGERALVTSPSSCLPAGSRPHRRVRE